MTLSRTLKTLAVSGLVISAVAANAFANEPAAVPATKPSVADCAKMKDDQERVAKGCEVKK